MSTASGPLDEVMSAASGPLAEVMSTASGPLAGVMSAASGPLAEVMSAAMKATNEPAPSPDGCASPGLAVCVCMFKWFQAEDKKILNLILSCFFLSNENFNLQCFPLYSIL